MQINVSEQDPTGLPLNLTTHVRQGQNNIRFIHLGDLSGHIFMLHVAESRPSPLSFPLDQILNSNYTPTQGPVNSHWHPYIHQSSTKTDQSVDACASTFKFFGKVTRSIQPLNY